ncbi:MAG: DUF805 domain-containing protein [Alphaproteobacteria bacterium]|nr:DUF805 domain-containing protein [Alphaproteobacteria bacterium]
MNYLQLYIDAFKQILDFKGRSDRTAFWSFAIISFIVSLILAAVFAPAAGIYNLVALVAGIMLSIRRGRDAGTPLWALLLLIPVVGPIILGILPRK